MVTFLNFNLNFQNFFLNFLDILDMLFLQIMSPFVCKIDCFIEYHVDYTYSEDSVWNKNVWDWSILTAAAN